MTQVIFQPYKWEQNETDDATIINIFGLTREGKRTVVKIPDFTPYVYLELDKKVRWTEANLTLLKNHIIQALHENAPVKSKFISDKKKNYYYAPAKFLWLAFKTVTSIKALERLFRFKCTIFGIGENLSFVVHESDATPILKLQTMRKVKPSDWIIAKQTNKALLLEEYASDRYSTCDIELVSSFADLSPAKGINKITNPKIVSYDIECVSNDKTGNTFPKASRKDDPAISIGATVGYLQDDEKDWKSYILVNEVGGKVCPDDLPTCDKVLHFKNERELLLGWTKFVNEQDPDVIISYNGLTFDDKYLTDRANVRLCWPAFSKLGRLLDQRAKTGERKWSSSAYGDQLFEFIDIPGRLHLDMLPIIFKDYPNLSSYTLNYVAEHFLGEKKVDLEAPEMMRKWHRGTKEDIRDINVYCVQDTKLPFKLMRKLKTWIDLGEKSNVMMVQMFDLVTRGQQVRVFSQQYCLAYDLGIVCQKKWSDYKPTDDEKEFVGATVQDPKCGYWTMVPTYDFKSLYPTTIIAYNICFSSYIPWNIDPPKEEYHDLYWESHQGCEHDKAVRKSKVTKRICKKDHHRFYKASIKKGIIPMLLEYLLKARADTRKEIGVLAKKLDAGGLSAEEEKQIKTTMDLLDKRQLAFKVSANSAYGGFGSDYSSTPFYPAAAATTAMGRESIKKAIAFAKDYRKDTILVYGDTDSCMLKFSSITNLKECFKVAEQMEKEINNIFPKPMYLELEKIYSKYFLLSKKRYVGYIVNPEGKLVSVDKKGVVIKRRDNCGYLREVYTELINMVMDRVPKWKIYLFLKERVDNLLDKNVDLEKLVITKSIKENYKSKNLPHVVVAEKMRSRGKYVATGTRIRYIFIKVDKKNAPQYEKAEDPDYFEKNQDTLEIDYLYYFEKQLVKPFDEVLEVLYGTKNIFNTLLKLIKKNVVHSAAEYLTPKFKVVE